MVSLKGLRVSYHLVPFALTNWGMVSLTHLMISLTLFEDGVLNSFKDSVLNLFEAGVLKLLKDWGSLNHMRKFLTVNHFSKDAILKLYKNIILKLLKDAINLP